MLENEVEEEAPISEKLLELERETEDYDWDHVGYVENVHDYIDSNGNVEIEVRYPATEKSFREFLDWPDSPNDGSKLNRLIDHEELAITKGNFDTIEGVAVPIDPDEEEIVLPPTGVEKRKAHAMKILYVILYYGSIVLAAVGMIATAIGGVL